MLVKLVDQALILVIGVVVVAPIVSSLMVRFQAFLGHLGATIKVDIIICSVMLQGSKQKLVLGVK